jgi:chemotaxis protein MotA
MVQTPLKTFMLALKRIRWMFMPPAINSKGMIEKIVSWSQLARKEGLLSLQAVAEEEKDNFSKNGLQMLADGGEPESIRGILEVEMEISEGRMGLIHVMNNLADPSALGPGIAVAFVATIYGVGLANLFFLPMANKLKSIITAQTQYRVMIIDGLVSIAEGENPRNIESKLQGYL